MLCALAALCLVLSMASCAARIPVDTEYRPESEEHARIVDLAFVTNRLLLATRDGGSYYSDDHGDLTGGRCVVGFKEGGRRGEVLRVDTRTTESVIPSSDQGRIVIYIHGYGESFERNCRRGALLKDRLRIDDRMLMFSWPASHYLSYGQDIADLAQSLDQLNEILTQVLQRVPADRVVLMAHSLGSRGLVDALAQRAIPGTKLAEAIFVAPDIRRDVFLENLSMLQQRVSEITVYMSDYDRVLWLSAFVNTSGRLGLAKEFDVDLDRISVVDVTPTGTNDLSGHLYHMYNPAVIEDLQILIGAPAIDRAYRRVPMDTPGFWSLNPASHDEE